jgi:hypothetical protein
MNGFDFILILSFMSLPPVGVAQLWVVRRLGAL